MATKTIGLFNTLLMLMLITFWGSSFVVIKVMLNAGLSPLAIATFRFMIAGILFFSILFFKSRKNQNFSPLIKRSDFLTFITLALSGVTLFFWIQYTGIKMVNASIASIFVCLLAPILITIFSTKILHETLNKKQFYGLAIAAIGTTVIVSNAALNFTIDRTFFFGTLILLITPILWTIYSLVGKRTMEKYSPIVVVSYVNGFGGLLLIPFYLVEVYKSTTKMNSIVWFGIFYLAITCSLLGYYIWFYVIKQVGAAVTSSFLFAEPLITVLFAIIFVGENINLPIIIGGLLTFIGVYLVTRNM